MVADAYMMGWTYAGPAWDILWNPDTSFTSKNLAFMYMTVWGGFHLLGAIGTGILVYAAIATVVEAVVGCLGLMATCREKVAVPVISQSAANEYLVKGNPTALNNFLAERGGKIVGDVSVQAINALQTQATSLSRSLPAKDAAVLGAAMRDGLTIMTRDVRFTNYLNFIGFRVEGY